MKTYMKKVDFDDYAEEYREIATKGVKGISGVDSNYFGEYKVKLIREEIRAEKSLRILDLGCGDGLNSIYFRKYFRNIEYTGIDVSEGSIKQAQKLSKRNVQFKTYDGKNIPYKDHTFDVILIACVLHHVPHTEHSELLSECRRVLKDHGVMFIFEHNPMNPVTRKIVKDCVFDADAVLVWKNKLKNILHTVSFNKIKASYIIFFPRKGIFNKMVRMEKLLGWLPLGGQYYLKCGK